LELSLDRVESADGVGDLALELLEGGVHRAGSRYTASPPGRYYFAEDLLQLGEGLFGGLGLFAVGVKLEIGLILSDGFVFFLHLLRDLS